MRLLHNLTGITKIFKYQDFANDPSPEEETDNASPAEAAADPAPDKQEPEKAADDPMPSVTPFLTFSDEDLIRNNKVKSEEKTRVATEPEAGVEEKAVSQEELLLNEAREGAKAILEQARAAADQMMSEAGMKASKMQEAAREEGYKSGYETGLSEGRKAGEEQALFEADQKYRKIFDAADEACDYIDVQKQELLRRHLDDLSELTLTIAEKVIHVALESCGEVIKRMIVSAAKPAMDKQWAKIMISAKDAEMMKADGIDIRKALGEISGRINLMIVDDAPQGTCLIEFPDQAVDAGAGTQLKNIKDIVRNAEKV